MTNIRQTPDAEDGEGPEQGFADLVRLVVAPAMAEFRDPLAQRVDTLETQLADAVGALRGIKLELADLWADEPPENVPSLATLQRQSRELSKALESLERNLGEQAGNELVAAGEAHRAVLDRVGTLEQAQMTLLAQVADKHQRDMQQVRGDLRRVTVVAWVQMAILVLLIVGMGVLIVR